MQKQEQLPVPVEMWQAVSPDPGPGEDVPAVSPLPVQMCRQ